ncbi:MAG TPA: hypothetical protein VNE83_05840 [Terriglobales bacterium]|nr:hypothetical protein [Terriglobales bacterium]
MADYKFLLETRLSQDQQLTLQMIERLRLAAAGARRAAGLNLYLTGGSMRDLVAGQPVRSLEITTEGDPVALAGALGQAGAERLETLEAPRGVRFMYRGVRVRMAAARTAAGPATIMEALRHRGLTLNSIGLSLNAGSRGLPLDPTNGIGDIEARLVRMNDAYVFYEDPIVLLRAVRLQVRLEFTLEERTAARMATAQEGNYLERAAPEARGLELAAIAYQPGIATLLRALEAGHWLEPAFGKGVQCSKMQLPALARLPEVVEAWQQLGLTIDSGLPALALMLGQLAPADQNRLTRWLPDQRLREWKKLSTTARSFEALWLKAASSASGDWLRRSQAVIEKVEPEAVVFASLRPQNAKAGKRLAEFQTAAQQARSRIPLGVLRGLGLAPRSLRAEEIVRPLYRRLLGGEGLSDAEITADLRAAVMEPTRPPAAAAPARAARAPRAAVAAPAKSRRPASTSRSSTAATASAATRKGKK